MKKLALMSRSKKPLAKGQVVWIKCKVVDVSPAVPAVEEVTDHTGMVTVAAQPEQPAVVHVAPCYAPRVKGARNPVLITVPPTIVEH